MGQVDPFFVSLPPKISRDPELLPYFNYLQKFLHDLWTEVTGGGIGGGDVAHLSEAQTFTAAQEFTADVSFTGAVLKVDGVQVVGSQQAAIADVAAATASNPSPPGGFSAPASGAVTVTSSAATDLTTTAQRLETLITSITAYELIISALVVDVEEVRTKLNSLLAELRTHGLIDT